MAAIPLIIVAVLILILYQAAKKGNYSNEVEEISKEEYALKDLIPIGLVLLDKITEKRLKKINEATYEKIVTIYGMDAMMNFRIYVGNKLLLSLITITVIYFFQMANGKISPMITVGALVAAIGVYYFSDSMLDEKIAKRGKDIRYDFPEFLSKLTLLINAGLTFENAWQRILESNKSEGTLYLELERTFKDIKANKPRENCLRDLARRCKVNEITKFSTIVLQNLSKGSSDMTVMLENLANECWNHRKSMAKQKGEEASTKLLFPMMLMLIAVFIITIVPAVMQMFAF